MVNADASAKRHHMCEKDYIWNPCACSCKNSKYFASIIDNSVRGRNKNSSKKHNLGNKKFLYFTYLFIDYYSIIDSF